MSDVRTVLKKRLRLVALMTASVFSLTALLPGELRSGTRCPHI